MGVSLEQWRAAIGSFSASIKACDLPHCSVALCHVDTLFSVLWFVATISLQSMKKALMLLILLSGDVERNPGPDIMKCTPYMTELCSFQAKSRKINIADDISDSWRNIGTALLNDMRGVTVQALYESNLRDVGATCNAILRGWVQGRGMNDKSWKGLLGVLDQYCPALATEIKDALLLRQPLKEGYVKLRGAKGILWGYKWSKKWMVLCKDRSLYFQDSPIEVKSDIQEKCYVQEVIEPLYNSQADWPKQALKGNCGFIVRRLEAAEPCYVVADGEPDKGEWMKVIQGFQKEPASVVDRCTSADDDVEMDGPAAASEGIVAKKCVPRDKGHCFDVFLSYKDEAVSIKCAKTVCKYLTDSGFKVYMAENELFGGDDISEKLAATISNTPIFLPILSYKYMTEAGELWCKNELDFAKLKKRKLLPVVIKGVIITSRVQFIIGNTKYLNYDPCDPRTGIESIKMAVNHMLSGELSGLHVPPVGEGDVQHVSHVGEDDGPEYDECTGPILDTAVKVTPTVESVLSQCSEAELTQREFVQIADCVGGSRKVIIAIGNRLIGAHQMMEQVARHSDPHSLCIHILSAWYADIPVPESDMARKSLVKAVYHSSPVHAVAIAQCNY